MKYRLDSFKNREQLAQEAERPSRWRYFGNIAVAIGVLFALWTASQLLAHIIFQRG